MTQPSPDDRALIDDLYARYSWALDTGDTDAYVDLYLPDAEVVEHVPGEVRTLQGHDEIRDFVLRFHGNPEFPGRQHRSSQFVITPDPERRSDRWCVRSYVLTTQFRDGEPPSIYWCGWADDVVAKVSGRWFLARREIKPWSGDVLARFAAPIQAS